MDESYLDNLLNEFSLDKEIDNKIEDELDAQIENEKNQYQAEQEVSQEDAFNQDLEQDAMDGIPESDLDFSEAQIDELDQLDNLADLDLNDTDFSDIDFDDLDMTKLNLDSVDSDFDDLLKDFEGDFEIPSFSDKKSDEEALDQFGTEDNNINDEDDYSTQESVEDSYEESYEDSNEGQQDDTSSDNFVNYGSSDVNTVENVSENGDLNEDNFDADSFLDSLLEEDGIEEASNNIDEQQEQQETQQEVQEGAVDNDDPLSDESLEDMLGGAVPDSDVSEDSQFSGADLSDDDLFSMLNMEENGGGNDNPPASESVGEGVAADFENGQLDMSALEGLDDIEDISEKPKKKKRSLMEILFGPPDEDDEPTEEELKAIEEKKAAKKAKKEADAEKKKEQAEKDKAEKSKKDADKKKAAEEKKKVKAELKAKRKAEEKAEAAKEKKLNKPMVIFIFSVLIGGVGFLYLSSMDFNYKLAIEHAANYFASQKYRKAYDEIKGVDVKEKDQELKDRIYTVMYVERLFESYENNIALGRNKKALDSLLRGVSKYYEYYDDAQELDIVSDLDFSFAQIQNALQQNYGITLERALEINELDDYEYMKTVSAYTDEQSE